MSRMLTKAQALAWARQWFPDISDPFEAAGYMGCYEGPEPWSKAEWREFIKGVSWHYEKVCAKHGVPRFHDFYISPEWQRVRYEVLAENNGLCRLCGRNPITHGVALHVDHIVPRSKNKERELDKTNLQVLCEDCNLGKGNRDEIDWRCRP